ncbi:MAG: hypothetical protein QOI78_939, partial [Actinomycetota bacterium]|nr:hypothetical protein [Actinomycetota bacterium]
RRLTTVQEPWKKSKSFMTVILGRDH